MQKCRFKKPIALRTPRPAAVLLLTRVLSAHAGFKLSWRDRFSELRAAVFPAVISVHVHSFIRARGGARGREERRGRKRE